MNKFHCHPIERVKEKAGMWRGNPPLGGYEKTPQPQSSGAFACHPQATVPTDSGAFGREPGQRTRRGCAEPDVHALEPRGLAALRAKKGSVSYYNN